MPIHNRSYLMTRWSRCRPYFNSELQGCWVETLSAAKVLLLYSCCYMLPWFLWLKWFKGSNVCHYFKPGLLICIVRKIQQCQLLHKLYSNHSYWVIYCGLAYLHTYNTKYLKSTWTFPTNIIQVVENKCSVPFICDFSEFTCQSFNLK